MLGLEPPAVVLDGSTLERGDVRRLDRVVEPAPGAGVAAAPPVVLLPAPGHVERRLEVRLTHEGGAVAGLLREVGGAARRVYVSMFVLSLALELYGTALGNWH